MEFIDLETAPDVLLHRLGKDARLIPYGGANFGMPLALIEPPVSRIVPTAQFFVRSNGPVPVINPESWRLTVTGAVEQSLTFALRDLEQLSMRTLESFLECAGNSRTRFDPLPPGTPWANDAVGNAIWQGVALADLLALCGVCDSVVDVVAQGADFPGMQRGLPLATALHPEVLVVTHMNGEPLTVAHGGPVRLLVPGWAGIASTKWLVGLHLINEPFAGFWNTDNYVFWDADGSALRPIAEMPPKSVIVSPETGERLTAGEVDVHGWAWSGYGAVRVVEISLDGGATWQAAELAPGERTGWRRWHHRWRAEPGQHRLLARAMDERGLRQPRLAPWNAKGYQMNAIHEVAVKVGA